MKTIIYIFILCLLLPIFSKAQTGLQAHWNLFKIIDIQTNNELFADLTKRGTLIFTDSIFSGKAVCNSFGGNYKATNENVKTTDVASTMIGCNGSEEELEFKILVTIKKTFSYSIVNDTLTITDNRTSKLIYFREE